MTRIV